jgi:hypothetical protein
MFSFDVAKDWVVLTPSQIPAARKAGEELAYYIAALRKQGGLVQQVPVQDAAAKAPADHVPVILLNAGEESRTRGGFSWRAGTDRIEIYGKSDRGLRNGVFDFLSALGIYWPEPSRERLPPFNRARPYLYDLKYARSQGSPEDDKIRRRRLIFAEYPLAKNSVSWLVWAGRNKIDAVVFPLRDESFACSPFGKSSRDALLKTAEDYAFVIEAGGWDLSLLVPRRLFLSNRELFRMDSGNRKKDYNFCPTSPGTMEVLKKEGGRIFRANPQIDVFHLWPDQGHETAWCSCPACRAFSAEEQNRIAVNTAADILAETAPGAVVSYLENSGGEIRIEPRKNTFKLGLPEDTPAEKEGIFWAK